MPEKFEGKSQEELLESEEAIQAKTKAGEVFDAIESGDERYSVLSKALERFVKEGILKKEDVENSLKSLSEIDNREKFINGVLEVLLPVLDFKELHPAEFEKLEYEMSIEQGYFTRLNETLSYGRSGEVVHIHLVSSRELGIAKLKKLVLEGLEELAKVVEKDEKIKIITATSWIVAKNPKLLEKLGFTVTGPISEKERVEFYPGDDRDVSSAEISRDEFLEKYLK